MGVVRTRGLAKETRIAHIKSIGKKLENTLKEQEIAVNKKKLNQFLKQRITDNLITYTRTIIELRGKKGTEENVDIELAKKMLVLIKANARKLE